MEAAGEEPPKESTANALPPNNINTPEGSPAPQPPDTKREDRLSNKQRREERLKVDKNVEQFMKSLNSVPTLEEKFSMVCKKFAQTSDENRKLHFYIKQTEKKFVILEKEKDQLQLEYNKVVLVKSKLENLCRELQKQNKAVKEESLQKIREEEERRKETQAKFQNTLAEITALLQQNNEKNAKLRDDNISMTEKFKSVVQQYQLREQQVDKMTKQMSLEAQLSDAKLKKASLEHQAEKERILAEMEQLKVTLAQYRAKILELQSTESALKGQLTVYTYKYDEFQNALVKSNQMFGGFKEQMEKMSKKIQKLEKESLSWKKRWETSQTALLDMCGERQATEERYAANARQLHHMQSLCRTLQAERTQLVNTLKEHNIERPPLAAAPAPPPPPATNAKFDAMAANCAQLRQSLAHIQSQLTTLSNNNEASKEEAAKVEKPKKSKSKKSKAEKQAQKLAAEKAEVKEREGDEAIAKSSSEEPQPSAAEFNVQNEGSQSPEDKIDSKTMESLIQAINMANLNLCDLEVINDDDNDDNISKDAIVEEITDDEIAKLNDIAALDTISNKPVLTVSNKPIDTISNKPVDTVSNKPVNTVSNKPVDTVSNKPVDTVLNKLVDTVSNKPVDTVSNKPGNTVSNEPVDTVPNKPVDTVSNKPIDTVSYKPVDTVSNESVDTDSNKPVETNTIEIGITDVESATVSSLDEPIVIADLGTSTSESNTIVQTSQPQVNGDSTVKVDDIDELITNESNDNLLVDNITTEEVPSPKKSKDVKETDLQERTQVDTQNTENQSVINES